MTCVLEVKEQYINGVIVHNPLEPITSKKTFKLVWDYEKTLYDYLEDLPQDYDWLIIYNAEQVTLEEAKNIKPSPDSLLIVTPNILGGGRNSGGKQTTRMIVSVIIIIVAVIVSIWNAPAGASLFKAGMSGLAYGGAISAIYTTSSMLIWNKPVYGEKKEIGEDETYGTDGAVATAKEGIPVGLCYGEYRIAGNIIQGRTENVGNSQDIYLLQSLSEGEVESISNILVNKQPLEQFHNVEVETRNGVANQELIPWFDDTTVSENKGVEITTEWLSMRTNNKLEKFTIDLNFPYGMYYDYISQSGNGATVATQVNFEVEYKSTSEDDTKWRRVNSVTTAYIKNLYEIEDGNNLVFVDENKVKRIYAFHNILYTDTLSVFDGDTLKEIYIYVQKGNTTEDSIKNLQTAMKKNYNAVDNKGNVYEVQAPSLLLSYDKFSNGLFNITFTPYKNTSIFTSWDLYFENNTAEVVSFKTQGGKTFSVVALSKTQIRRTISSEVLPLDYYDVRIRRTNAKQDGTIKVGKYTHTTYSEVYWMTLNETIFDDIQYNHTALMGVKIRLDGQLGSTPNITADVKGIKCKHYNYDGEVLETKWTANPAWIVLDMLTNKRYGGGVNSNRIDFPKFIEWAEYCEENNIEFNGYFATSQNLWDTIQTVTMVGHADLIICGTKFSLSIDRQKEPIYLFNNSNIIKDSMKTSWSGLEDRCNCFTLTYYNKEDDYRQTSIKIVDSENVATQGDLKEQNLTVIGITNEEQARRELKRLVLKNKYLQQSIEFSSPVEAVGCTIGDVVIVQHDVPQWGYGGKLKSGCTTETLRLDRTVSMEENKDYVVLIHHDAVLRLETFVQNVINKSIYIPGKLTDRVRRLIHNGQDLEIVKVNPGAQMTEIVLLDAGNFSVGDSIQLWDTDVLEEVDVVTDAYKDLDVIVLQKPLKWEPKAFSNWLFGHKGRYQKKFFITGMEGLNTEEIKISAIEYSDDFYDFDNYEGNDPIISDISTKMKPVYNLSASESLAKVGSSFITNVKIDWETTNLTTYFGADVYLRRSSELPFEKVAEVKDGVSSYIVSDLNDNDYFEIKVVGFDGVGRRADFNESPILTHTILGKSKLPDTPTGFEIRKTNQGLMLAWNIVNEADVTGYIIKQGTEWISGTVVDDNVSNNRYTIQYTEAGIKNFMVKTKDAFGNESELPAYASITLDPPLDPIDFMSVQNNDFIVLKWNNLDDSVVKFRIKEGESWGSGTIVADVSGYSHSVPINGYYNRKFWIKSIDQFGVFCANAVYTSPMAIEHQTKNVIVEYPESDNGFIHPRLNFDLINDDLIIRENKKYGEYSWYVGLGEKLYARVISEDEVDAIAHSPKWKDFKVRWNAFEAQSPWVVKASLDNVQIERQMALPTDKAPADVLESFSYYMKPNGDYANTQPIIPMNFEYSNGRFREGIVVDDTVSLGYNINIPAIFSLRFWVRPKLLVTSGYINILNPLEGHFLRLYYNSTTRAFILKDYLGQEISATTDFVEDEPILIGISQSATTRSLMIGFSNDLKVVTSSKELKPLGDFTQFYFR